MSDQLQSLGEVLADAERQLGRGVSAAARVTPIGFQPLDGYLGGGLRAGELSLLGGPQGLGKTTMALQMLRNVVAAGGVGIYFSFEHDAATVLERFIGIESGARDGVEGIPIRRVRDAMENAEGRAVSLAERMANLPGGVEALQAVEAYAPRLFVHRSSGSLTDVRSIRTVIEQAQATVGVADLVVIDYLQKIPVLLSVASEDDRITQVTEGLKDLALDMEVPVLAVVAADKDGITSGRRMRVYHLRGAAALAYEADVVLVLNDKYDVVARHHLVFDVGNAERFRNFAVVTIEKNRTGLDRIELEFRKRFEQGRFETEGQPVNEQLVDERVFVE
ncbi:MAG: DnaB-like helicase C-terminal domain-containing protein [Actinomycetes bacterium]